MTVRLSVNGRISPGIGGKPRCLTIRVIRSTYAIEERVKQLGRADRYQNELSKITRSKKLPSDWASPDQRCRAAIKAVGKYGEVIPLSDGRKQV